MNRLAAIGVLALAACGGDSSTLTIENQSSFSFVEINLAAIDSTSFGPDLLGNDVLAPGEVLELSNIACGVYDIRITDEDGDQCILDTVDLCRDNALWQIDDGELAACQF